MIFNKQDVTGPKGNCMMTCYCNYLDLNVEECPKFEILDDNMSSKKAHRVVRKWFLRRGYNLFHTVDLKIVLDSVKDDYYFASGPCRPGSSVHHLVICKSGEIVFDPHPKNVGIAYESFYWYFLPGKQKINRKQFHPYPLLLT